MTIAAAYLTSEGVVLGSDSATAVQVRTPDGREGVAQVFRYAQKVFEVGENARLGACTWGSGSVGRTSHRTLIARLGDIVEKQALNVKAAADELIKLVCEERDRQSEEMGGVGYYLGGWDLQDHTPSCYQISVSKKGKAQMNALKLGMGSFSGVPAFFTRVFRGYDGQLPSKVLEALKEGLGDGEPPEFDKLFNGAFQKAAAPLVAAGYRDLPIREAIDFIHAYLHITVKAVKFTFGPPTCGGPIEVAFISTDRRFRWVCHKSFDAAIGGA